jgi:hypothetical protein
MRYSSPEDWLNSERKHVLLFGMSGLGKTYLSQMLRAQGEWFHYSIDYRIGTRYMGEYIADNAKAEAMKVPFLRELLMSDSIYIGSNITFENLTPVATYLGKPGDLNRGGVEISEYRRRQEQFRTAEVSALMDTGYFIERAQKLYGYPHFICDTGGSICEWVNPENKKDPVLTELSKQSLMVWIKGSAAHTEALIERFDRAPKPMSYQPEFLSRCWEVYLAEQRIAPARVDPDAFIRWTYAKALAHRQPRYEGMADWGVTITADEVENLQSADDFNILIATALARRET